MNKTLNIVNIVNCAQINVKLCIFFNNFDILQGVVRKTVSDDLVENIWEPVHMDKIMPSLLYNMQNAR